MNQTDETPDLDSTGSFLSQYLAYVGETEAPVFYHRWCCLSMIGAYLGRQFSFPFGHSQIYPNMYMMLIGDPGARKSTAIKLAKKIITSAGYNYISAEKSSKEKFMLDLAGESDAVDSKDGKAAASMQSILEENIWGTDAEDMNQTPREMYIACDEFNDFIGMGNMEFISLLGNLWDFNGQFVNRIKTGKSVSICDPTISIMGGNTPVSFSNAFPPETLGQGFFSRLILVQGDPTGRKITFPVIPSAEETYKIVSALQRIKIEVRGECKFSAGARYLLDKIYQSDKPMTDARFTSYSNRRFTHLLKLCIIIAASHYSTELLPEHVVEANTILTHTEHLMPKALGEFGKSRNSDITHRVMQILNVAETPVLVKDIWANVHNDMEKLNDLIELLRNLVAADKIFTVGGGYLSKGKMMEEVNNDMLDYNYLTAEEREMKK